MTGILDCFNILCDFTKDDKNRNYFSVIPIFKFHEGTEILEVFVKEKTVRWLWLDSKLEKAPEMKIYVRVGEGPLVQGNTDVWECDGKILSFDPHNFVLICVEDLYQAAKERSQSFREDVKNV